MPVVNRIAEFSEDMKTWRRWMHQHPELQFECHETAAFVVERLREFGVDEIHEGIATTGVVAIINGQGDGPTIGLRADMDALPILETTGAEYASLTDGKMHACGHDGHTTMLLGAARYLAETRRFKGRVALIFQPAEEGGAGAKVMVDEGALDNFDIGAVYALHCKPGSPPGGFLTTPGPMMAAVDTVVINVKGQGGHGAMPHLARDPVVAAVAIVQAIQTISSRNMLAQDELAISVTQIHTGTADNVIPETAFINATIRTFDKKVQALVQRRMAEIVEGTAAAYGVTAELDYVVGYPATVNDADHVQTASQVAREIAGDANVHTDMLREMGAEDFSYMLEQRPGAYLYLGQGDSADWHHPAFDFNDDVAPVGASFFARLVETTQPL